MKVTNIFEIIWRRKVSSSHQKMRQGQVVTAVGGQVVLGPSQLVMTFVRDSSIIDLTLCHPSETNNKKVKAG